MRKVLFVIVSMMVALNSWAGPVSLSQARQKAAEFVSSTFSHSNDRMMSLAPSLNPTDDTSGNSLYYIFNVGRDNGFVIVSGDDRTTPVLGYAEEGSVDPKHLPENLKYWLESYRTQLEALSRLDDEQARQAVRAPRKTSVTTRNSISPLVTSKWDQATPYWNECPQFMNSDNEEDGYELAYTGCVATSMAQIMNFHKSPAATTEVIPAYTFTYSDGNYNYAQVEMPELPVTEFDWDHMLDTYTGAEAEAYTSAVAHLMLYAGSSVKMQYGTSSSGAYTDDIPKGLAYFGYGSSIAFRTDYTQDEWDDLVYSELAAGRPMIYNGTAGSGGGHSFICDGFEYGDYFHINWGWGGMGNGFFQLSILNPSASGIGGSSSSEGYNMKQNIIYNIIPGQAQSGETGEEDPVLTVTAMSGPSAAWERDGKSYPFKIYKSRIVKVSYADHAGSGKKFKEALALYDPSAETYTVLDNSQSYYYSTVTTSALGQTTSYGSGVASNATNVIKFGAGLTGTYRLVAMYQLDGSDEWLPMEGSDRIYLELNLDNYSASYTAHPDYDLSVSSWEFSGGEKVGVREQVKATIQNSGSDRFFGDLYLDFGGQQLDEYSQYTTVVQAEIPAEGEQVVTFNVSPASSGTKSVHVMLVDNYGSFNNISGTGSVTIAESDATGELDLSVVIEAVDAAEAVDANTHGTIYDSRARFKATITNYTDGEYNKYVLAPLFICTWDETSNAYSGAMVTYKQSELSLAAHGSKTLYFEFDNLASGSVYSMNVYARNYVADSEEGSHLENIVEAGQSKYYAIKPGIVTWKGDGTRSSYKPVENFSVADDVAAVSLVSLGLGSIAAGDNPNTLYFLGEDDTAPSGLDGKNVVYGKNATSISLEDGYDFYTPQSFTAGSISYERTFTVGHNNSVKTGWSTIVLPFAPTKVVNQTDGKEIDWFRSSSDSGKQFWLCNFEQEDGQTVYFSNASEMLANVPYLVAVPDNKWGKKWDLRNKAIVWSAENVTVKPEAIAFTSGRNLFFGGTMCQQSLEGILGINDEGSQFCLSGSQTVDAFHAYFDYIDRESSAQANALNIAIIDDSTDGIEGVAAAETTPDTKVYDLKGRCVGTRAGLNQLPRGIYLMNGRKVVR